MAHTVIVHLLNEDPCIAEIERLPEPEDNNITLLYPRRRDGKPLHYLSPGVTTVVFPWHRINFLEIVPQEEKKEEIAFYRE